jgi:hypothetical protein
MCCGNCGMRIVELILALRNASMVEVNAYDQLMVGVMSTSTLEVTCMDHGRRRHHIWYKQRMKKTDLNSQVRVIAQGTQDADQ